MELIWGQHALTTSGWHQVLPPKPLHQLEVMQAHQVTCLHHLWLTWMHQRQHPACWPRIPKPLFGLQVNVHVVFFILYKYNINVLA